MHKNFLIALLFTLLAGLSTGIGSVIAFFAKKDNKKFLSFALGFSAGVMLYVSFVEIFADATETLVAGFGNKIGNIIAVASFFAGMILIAVIDKLIPEVNSPYNVKNIEKSCRNAPNAKECKEQKIKESKLMRSGVMMAVILTIHNFPEGLASFLSTLNNAVLAIPIVVAIAIHNIPEGIAISVPIYQSTGSKKKAFFYSLLSGMAEPVGAVIGYFILMPFLSETVFGILFAIIAGIMVFISLDELLPTAREYGSQSLSIAGLLSGMAVIGNKPLALPLMHNNKPKK